MITPLTRISTLLLLVVLLTGAALASAQDGGDSGLSVTLDPDHPTIAHGDSGDYDDRFTDMGAFFYHDGQFHMFRNGFRQWPGVIGVSYHTSTDGLTWEEVSDGPVFTSEIVDFGQQSALPTAGLVEDDGTWVLYFYTVGNQFSDNPSAWAIGRATAPDPLGPWTVDPAEPVLLPGPEGEWDAARVSVPNVFKTDDGYVMFFDGFDSNGALGSGATRQIGMATSADGVEWTRYDDPATTDAPFAASDPVFVPAEGDAWDSAWVGQPRVVLTPDGYVMSYKSSAPGGGSDQSYGLAISTDGVQWTRVTPDAPLFWDKDVLRRHLWFNGLAYGDGDYFFAVEIQRGYQNETDIYVGALEGDPFQ